MVRAGILNQVIRKVQNAGLWENTTRSEHRFGVNPMLSASHALEKAGPGVSLTPVTAGR